MRVTDWELLDKPWGRRKVEELVKSWNYAYLPMTDEWFAEDGDGYLGMRTKAYDSGDPEAILDCIQLEQDLKQISDPYVKAAVFLRMYGWDDQEIGAALKSRRTGRSLVEHGISWIAKIEREKYDADVA